MNENYSDIDLAKYFSGEASADEKLRIEAWSKRSPTNKEAFRAAKFVWDRLGLIPTATYDTERALSKVHSKINIRKSPKLGTMPIYLRIAAIAAVILLPVLFIVFHGNFVKNDAATYSVVASDADVRYVKLFDGTEVWLNRYSRILIPEKYLGNEFVVKLEGEAYFEVEKNTKRVFVVECGTTTVKVLGTAFNLRARKGEENNVISVTEGKVLCTVSAKVEKIVEKGNEAAISPFANTIQLQPIKDNNFMSWKTRVLKFSESPFEDVAKKLSDFYQIRFIISDSSLLNLPISTTIINASADEVVNILHMASDEIEINKIAGGYEVKRRK